MHGNPQQYTDSMQRYIERAIDDYMNPKISSGLKKKAGQIIFEINDYLEFNYPSYAKKVQPYRLLSYVTDKEAKLLLEIEELDHDKFLETLKKISKPRMSRKRHRTDKDVEIIIPYIANFLKDEKAIGQQTTF